MNDRISELLTKHQVLGISFQLTKEAQPMLILQHVVQSEGGQSQIEHRCIAASPAEALERVFKLVDHCSELTPRIVKLNAN
jgi:hypothetical protein